MKSESFDILKELLGEPVKQIAKETIKESLEELLDEMMRRADKTDIDIEHIKRCVERMANDDLANASRTAPLFGVWPPNQPILMHDERLWNLERNPSAPFSSYFAVQRAKAKRPEIFVRNDLGHYVVIAQDLYDYVNNKEARDIAEGKKIKFNHKRK